MFNLCAVIPINDQMVTTDLRTSITGSLTEPSGRANNKIEGFLTWADDRPNHHSKSYSKIHRITRFEGIKVDVETHEISNASPHGGSKMSRCPLPYG